MSKQLSFEEALDETSTLLSQVRDGSLNHSAMEETISRIVSTPPGARGFLVNYLTSDLPLADELPQAVLKALSTGPDVVYDLLAKNLVMSTTMALTHERNGDLDGAQGSLRVQRRTAQIISSLASEKMRGRLDEMWRSITQDSGEYVEFLRRWRYDEEQLLKAQEVIKPLRIAPEGHL